MAKVTQVVLMHSKSYSDSRRKFKQNVPVTLSDPKEIARYRGNGLFAVREIEDKRATEGVSSQRVNPGDPFKNPVNEESTRLPQRKKKKVLKTVTNESKE